MRGLILKQINQGGYDLETIISRIDYFCANGELSPADREELIALAREHAVAARRDDPEILALWTAVRDLQTKVKAIMDGTAEAYPEFVQPTGAHNAYNAGQGVTYNGKHYRSLIDGNVWSPDTYPAGWEEAE